jgi:hypothetical protein
MEIISIYVALKDGSVYDIIPREFFEPDIDLSAVKSFLQWAAASAGPSGMVELEKSSYDTAVELVGTDDLQCPLALVIEYKLSKLDYSLSIPFDRSKKVAFVSINDIGTEEQL